MAVWQIFKVSRKTFFNPTAWFNTDNFIASNESLYESVAGLFRTPKAARKESFEEAKKRLHLTEESIRIAKNNYLYAAILFFLLGVFTFLFSFYLLFIHVAFHGWVLALGAAALFFAQSYRSHFWYFQMKHRKLGCTFKEWRRGKPFREAKNG